MGVTLAADLAAPRALAVDAGGNTLLDSNGHIVATRAPVFLGGIDAEMKVVKTPNADVKPYVDYSMLAGGDGGFTLGVLGRFNAGEGTVHAVRVVLEARWLGSRYQPSYFDTFYEVEKFDGRLRAAPRPGEAQYDTKVEDVMSGRLPERLGAYLEVSWGVRGKVGLTMAVEGSSGSLEKNFVVHLEVPAVDFLQFFGSYYKRGFADIAELGALDEKTILFAGARLRLLPILFVNGRAFKTFRVNPNLGRYDNTFGFALDAELGWEF